MIAFILKYPLFFYLILLNLIGFFSMGIDKQKAIRHRYRIPEKLLFGIAAFGGSLGSIIGMYVFRHKTRHTSFVVGMPLILIIQAGLLCFFFFL